MANKLQIAGKQLLKGNFGNAYTALTTKSIDSELIQPGRYRNGSYFFGVNGADKAFIWSNYNSNLRAYQECPVVSAVINRKALCYVNGVQTIKDENGRESTIDIAKAVKKLLNKPNPYQTGREFRALYKVYQHIYGYCPIFFVKPVGFEKDISKWKMFALPPWMVKVEDSDRPIYSSEGSKFKSVTLTYMGTSTPLPLENVFFIKKNSISTGTYSIEYGAENTSIHLPDSDIAGLKKPISNIIDSLNSRGSLIRNRGPQWLLTNDTADSADAGLFPIDPGAKDELHKDLLQYGIMDGQRKAVITDAKLKLQTVGFDVAQLQLLEGELQDAKMICDGLNYPPYLLGLVDAKFDNQAIAERNLYTNSIIPDALSDDEQWSAYLGLTDKGLKIITDYSHLPAMQEDDVKRSTARLILNQALKIEWELGLITKNEWLKKLGEDPMTADGDVRITDFTNDAPLASIIGVGGVQSLISVLTASGVSEESRSATLQILFGISPENAAAMTQGNTATTETQTTANNG